LRETLEKSKGSVFTGLAGEYYVLAQLTQRGLVAALTLSNTKSVDILVSDRKRTKTFKIEAKTSIGPPRRGHLFHKQPFYAWIMKEAHERVKEKDLYYCFVALRGTENLPKFFIVPSTYVARYVRWEHRKWLANGKGRVNDTPMRTFRVPINDPQSFENNWAVFD
jgi:hypothetical protein